MVRLIVASVAESVFGKSPPVGASLAAVGAIVTLDVGGCDRGRCCARALDRASGSRVGPGVPLWRHTWTSLLTELRCRV